MSDALNPSDRKDRFSNRRHSTLDLDSLERHARDSQSKASNVDRLAGTALAPSLSTSIVKAASYLSEPAHLSALAAVQSESSRSIAAIVEAQNKARIDWERLSQKVLDSTGGVASAAKALEKHRAYFEAALSWKTLRPQADSIQAILDAASLRSDSLSIHDAILAKRGSDFERLFRAPVTKDIESLRMLAKPTLSSVVLKRQLSPGVNSVIDSLASMRARLIDTQDSERSIAAFTELHSVGAALHRLDAFGHDITRGLRVDLGDWRELPKFDPTLVLEPVARTELYVAQGLDERLTDFPEEAYSASLAASGLGEDYSLINLREDFLPRESSPAEKAATQRNVFGYEALLKFEQTLRDFLDRVMTMKYGRDWPKQRIHGDRLKLWKEAALAAAETGRPTARLIDYADFTDYERIIVRNDNFTEVFAPVFSSKQRVIESFNRLYPLRLATMHARTLTKEDVLYLVAETCRILQAISKSGL